MNVENEVKTMLAELAEMKFEDVTLESDLIDDLEIDSLQVIEIATEIEKRYKVKVKEDQLMGLRKVGEVIGLINTLLGNMPS